MQTRQRTAAPSVVIFTKGYYTYLSQWNTAAAEVSPAEDPKLTDAEKLARYEQWSPFTANSGTFELKGVTLTRRPTVAKNDAVMTGAPVTTDVQMEGDSIWLITKSAPGQPTSETRTKLTRLK